MGFSLVAILDLVLGLLIVAFVLGHLIVAFVLGHLLVASFAFALVLSSCTSLLSFFLFHILLYPRMASLW